MTTLVGENPYHAVAESDRSSFERLGEFMESGQKVSSEMHELLKNEFPHQWSSINPLRHDWEGVLIDEETSWEARGHSRSPLLGIVREAYRYLQWEHTDKSAVTSMIEAKVMPFLGITQKSPAIEAEIGESTHGACEYAESYFNNARLQILEEAQSQPSTQSKISVLHDDDLVPVLFCKTEENPTALTLQPIQISNTVIPEGTIITNHHGGQYSLVRSAIEKEGGPNATPYTLESFTVPDTFLVNPIRFSVWAYNEPGVRAQFADRESSRTEMFRSVTLDDFREAAKVLIEKCATN